MGENTYSAISAVPSFSQPGARRVTQREPQLPRITAQHGPEQGQAFPHGRFRCGLRYIVFSALQAAAHTLRKVSQVRVVTSLPKLRSITVMNTGPLGPGT